MTAIATATEQESWAGSRGVLASYGAVTPTRAADDPSRFFKLNLRDVLLLLMGCIAMYGAQLGAQYGLRSDMRDLKTSFDASVSQQNNTNGILQRQIDELRAFSKLAYEKANENNDKLSELKGIMIGAGITKERSK